MLSSTFFFFTSKAETLSGVVLIVWLDLLEFVKSNRALLSHDSNLF